MPFKSFFNNILVYPLLNLLVFFYNYIPDIGVVIILLTILIRLLLLPSFHKSLKHQKIMQQLQPKLDEIKVKYKDDQEQQAKAMLELWRAHKVNPLGSLSPLFIQLPILISLYVVFTRSLNGAEVTNLYSFVENPGHINSMFLNFIDLAKPNLIITAAAAILQYLQSKMMIAKSKTADPTAKMVQGMTLYFLPAMTLAIGMTFPAGLPLYWAVSTLFGIGQQYWIIRREAKEGLEHAK
jgi:YidC/Oxa1 family membrane protein insertase